MNDHQVTMLKQMVDEGISTDGLRIEPEGNGYRIHVPDGRTVVSSKSDIADHLGAYEPLVSNWYFWEVDVQMHNSAKRAFLRWLEYSAERSVEERYDQMHEEPIRRTWGELLLLVKLNEKGERIYEVKHHADRSKELDDLDVHVDPLNARTISKYDADGEYRPLKGAPSLASGWVFPGLRYEKLLKTVDYFYPASIVNWYYERIGKLDVTHYREAAERHTGIFDVIEELDSEQLTSVTEQCCTDDHCLKRRRWEESDTKTIDVPSGDGEIPCREPCQVLINEARDTVMASHHTANHE